MYIMNLINITKDYPLGYEKVHALRGIDLKIKKGDYVYITGFSGSGKSTLLHIMGFLDTPTSGKYLFYEEDTTNFSERKKALIRKQKIGFVFQNFYLFPYFNIFQNVEIALKILRKYSKKERKEMVEAVLEAVGLYEKRNRRPDELSGGERQRVAIARAVVKNPDVILADEPTGNLDSVTGMKIIELLEKFWQSGHTLVIVTHSDTIAKRGNYEVRLRDGKIIEILDHRG